MGVKKAKGPEKLYNIALLKYTCPTEYIFKKEHQKIKNASTEI